MNDYERTANLLKAVSDPNRLKIIACLKKGEVCVCDLVEALKISQPAVSQQLKKLKDAGIILERKKGTWKNYRLNEFQEPFIQLLIDQLEVDHTCMCTTEC